MKPLSIELGQKMKTGCFEAATLQVHRLAAALVCNSRLAFKLSGFACGLTTDDLKRLQNFAYLGNAAFEPLPSN